MVKGIRKWPVVQLEMVNAAKKVCNFSNKTNISLGRKYIKSPIKYIKKNKALYDLLGVRPGSSVFEIGPGVGYFLYICKEFGGCYVRAIDSRQIPGKNILYDQNSIYDSTLKELSIFDKVDTQCVQPAKKVSFYNKKYNYIVAIGGSFIRNWTIKDHKFFIKNCRNNLLLGGKILLQFNGDKVNSKIENFYKRISFHSGEQCLYIIHKDIDGV